MKEQRVAVLLFFDQVIDPRRNGFLNVATDDLGAFAAEQSRGRSPNSAVSAGYDCHFAFQPTESGPQ
jgi:hypothetical protein